MFHQPSSILYTVSDLPLSPRLSVHIYWERKTFIPLPWNSHRRNLAHQGNRCYNLTQESLAQLKLPVKLDKYQPPDLPTVGG